MEKTETIHCEEYLSLKTKIALTGMAMGLVMGLMLLIHSVLRAAKQQQEVHVQWLTTMQTWEEEMRTFAGPTKPADVLRELRGLQRDLDVKPVDVLQEVRELRAEIQKKISQLENQTDDRFRGEDFKEFLEANPDLKDQNGE